jgi:phytol kinase
MGNASRTSHHRPIASLLRTRNLRGPHYLHLLTSSPLLRFLPDATQSLTGLGVAAGVGLAAGWLATHLNRERGVRTPDTRKIFHFLVFTGAGVLQLTAGLGAVSAYGTGLAAIVLFAVYRGEGFGLFEALARPTDVPHRGLFVVVPLVMTVVGGVLANLLFPGTAIVGYWVTGWGDAVGEPVGVRWGRRRFRVLSLAGVPAYRSLEGSVAVFIASAVAAAAAFTLIGEPVSMALILDAVSVGVVAAAVEAISNHGLDNLTLQVVIAGVASVLVG